MFPEIIYTDATRFPYCKQHIYFSFKIKTDFFTVKYFTINLLHICIFLIVKKKFIIKKYFYIFTKSIFFVLLLEVLPCNIGSHKNDYAMNIAKVL